MNEVWKEIWANLGFESETAMWQSLYVEKKMSIAELSAVLGFARNTVKRRLKIAGIGTRPPGGPNRLGKTKFKGLPDTAFENVKLLASILDMNPSAVWKEKRKRKEALDEARGGSGTSLPGEGLPVHDDRELQDRADSGTELRGVEGVVLEPD